MVSLVLLLLLVAAGVLAARRFRALHADGSRTGQRWATAEAVAEVDGDAGALIRRALLQVTGAETSERFERRVTFVATPEANVGFTVTALGDGRTRVAITVAGTFTHSELSVRHGRERADLAHALAQWLTQHGDEAHVRHT
ncbi:hypothetical protein C8N24_5858 [Solirubrobacter pauli]|uniref:Uncharacterized protein n=1 Tax=Solirubrobacter pauli TaxID=166793 RepID=A0A660L4N0_9ACTN|nr:hypothetical protein [Solirubrobacter pauli]RKQ87829.1 hypothetical protein C8N24_5858 [Solirubrobacter pauli]